MDATGRPPVAAPSVLGTWAPLTLIWALDARGFDGHALAARAGIDLALLADPNSRYPITSTTRLWRLAVEVTGDPCFGLWASRFVKPTTFQALGFAVFASRTLREAFERMVRYSWLASDVAGIQLRRVGEREQIRYVIKAEPRPVDEAIDTTCVSSCARLGCYRAAR